MEFLKIKSVTFYIMKQIFILKYPEKKLVEFYKIFGISNSNPSWKYNGQIYGNYSTMSTQQISEIMEKDIGLTRDIAYFDEMIEVGISKDELLKFGEIMINSKPKKGSGKLDIKDKSDEEFVVSINRRIDEYIDKQTSDEEKGNTNNVVYRLFKYYQSRESIERERAGEVIDDIRNLVKKYKVNRKLILNYKGSVKDVLDGVRIIERDLEALNTIYEIEYGDK